MIRFMDTFVRLCGPTTVRLTPWRTRSDPVDNPTVAACSGELDYEPNFASLPMRNEYRHEHRHESQGSQVSRTETLCLGDRAFYIAAPPSGTPSSITS
ncbi:hypothetical protein EYF80_060941 [Liparis tanakae]|uniref:Uncharacterized protein n=1 Tax=Liparis tanakae TaxID=230148 RepID=A0A4Z2EKM7_9TELE|nr:hypothetical protein EYF80_060941 [Liparis tanakae]